MDQLTLSIIIASYNSKTTIERCLEALEKQRTEDCEIIVVDSSEDGAGDIVKERFPKVRLFRSTERKYPGEARNIGISRSNGEILAFIDADCIPDPNWIAEIIKAHESHRHPIIGGAIDNGNPESLVGWAYYFCELSQWMPQSRKYEMTDIPAGCLSMKRSAFDKYGPFYEGTYSSDTAFNWRAVRDGYKPLFAPSIKVYHINITDLWDYLRRKIFHGRCFATIRIKEQKFSYLRSLIFALLSPLLLLLLSYRRTVLVVRSGIYLREFILAFPLLLLGIAAWSLGEFLGYISHVIG
jgi:GT2 family glycosyltransferase